MSRLLKTIKLGETLTMTRVFTNEDVEKCAELTGDNNPMYLDKVFAGRSRYGRTIVQALLTEGLVTALINRYMPGPGAILLNKELVYPFPVYVDESITALVEVIDINEERQWITQKVICTNPDRQEVLRGQVVLVVENVGR